MSFRTLSRTAVAALAIIPLHAAAAHAQPASRIGDFSVEMRTDSATGQDASFAILWPGGGYFSPSVESGLLFLACGRDSAGLSGGVMLPEYGSEGDTLPVTLRLGRDEPETRVLEGGDGIVWFLRGQDVAPVFRRALQADSLVIQMPEESRSGQRARFAYGLQGLNEVLGGLGCTVAPPAPGPVAGRSILQGRTEGMVQRSAMDMPRPTNVRELMRYLERSYPRELWDARVTGEVLVRFRVMEDGRVDPASVEVKESANEAFDAVASEAVRRLCYVPARAYGRPVKVWIEQPIRFSPPARRPPARPTNGPPPACPPAR